MYLDLILVKYFPAVGWLFYEWLEFRLFRFLAVLFFVLAAYHPQSIKRDRAEKFTVDHGDMGSGMVSKSTELLMVNDALTFYRFIKFVLKISLIDRCV